MTWRLVSAVEEFDESLNIFNFIINIFDEENKYIHKLISPQMKIIKQIDEFGIETGLNYVYIYFNKCWFGEHIAEIPNRNYLYLIYQYFVVKFVEYFSNFSTSWKYEIHDFKDVEDYLSINTKFVKFIYHKSLDLLKYLNSFTIYVDNHRKMEKEINKFCKHKLIFCEVYNESIISKDFRVNFMESEIPSGIILFKSSLKHHFDVSITPHKFNSYSIKISMNRFTGFNSYNFVYLSLASKIKKMIEENFERNKFDYSHTSKTSTYTWNIENIANHRIFMKDFEKILTNTRKILKNVKIRSYSFEEYPNRLRCFFQ